MSLGFRTRKRGTRKQIGQKFPVMEKKKLPPKIKIAPPTILGKPWRTPREFATGFGGDTGIDADYYIWKKISEVLHKHGQEYAQVYFGSDGKTIHAYGSGDKKEVVKAIREVFGNKYKVVFDELSGGKIKYASISEQKKSLLEHVGYMLMRARQEKDTESCGYYEDIEKAIKAAKRQKKLDEIYEELDLTDEETGGKVDKKLTKTVKKDLKAISEKLAARDETKYVYNPESIRRFRKTLSPAALKIMDETPKYLWPNDPMASPGFAHLWREIYEGHAARKKQEEYEKTHPAPKMRAVSVRAEKPVRVYATDLTPASIAASYRQYLKDTGRKDLLKKKIAMKIRAVKYPVEKRGPSYQRYLQKLREKRAADKAKRIGGKVRMTKKRREILEKLRKEHYEDGATDAPLWGSLNFKPRKKR